MTRLFLIFTALALAVAPGAMAAPSCGVHLPYGAPLELELREGDRTTVCSRAENREIAFFVSHYDRARVAPDWVAYEMTRSKMVAVARSTLTRARDGRDFAAEPGLDTDALRSPSHGDFTGSGFDRGHFAPAEAVRWDREGYRATFSVANMALQASRFNSQLWQDLEAQVRGWACDFGTVYAVTGILHGDGVSTFTSRDRPEITTHIPTHFCTVVYTPAHGGRGVGIIFSNVDDDRELRSGIRSVAVLERLTGLDFFPDMRVPTENLIRVT